MNQKRKRFHTAYFEDINIYFPDRNASKDLKNVTLDHFLEPVFVFRLKMQEI